MNCLFRNPLEITKTVKVQRYNMNKCKMAKPGQKCNKKVKITFILTKGGR